MKIEVKRDVRNEKFTLGKMYIDGEFFCYTLEDPVRQAGVKIYGDTAIPALSYEVVMSFSEKFRKPLPLLLDVPGFSGVRMHGGNTVKDTLGCVLVANNRDTGRGVIWGSASEALKQKISSAVNKERVVIIITNMEKK